VSRTAEEIAALLLDAEQQGLTPSQLAEREGVPLRLVYQWRHRHRKRGLPVAARGIGRPHDEEVHALRLRVRELEDACARLNRLVAELGGASRLTW